MRRLSVYDGVLKIEIKSGMLLPVASGSALPQGFENNVFLLALFKAARFLRWLACSAQEGSYKQALQDANKSWPEATIFAIFWQSIENHMLMAWKQFMSENRKSLLVAL